MTSSKILQPGAKAPEFDLKSAIDRGTRLRDFSGKPVVLVFYPADWSPVCGDELDVFNEALPEIERSGATLVGLSVDNVWSHLAFSKSKKLRFPLLSDFEPKGKVARSYGAYEDAEGLCSRALFLIDGNGVISWSYLSPAGVNPGVDGVLEALDELKSGKEGAA